MALDEVGQVADSKYYLVYVMSLKVLNHMLQERFVNDGHHGLGEVAGERT
jgi:hypothetical protein